MGLGYAGADLLVTGTAPPGARVLVSVSSQPTTVTLGRSAPLYGGLSLVAVVLAGLSIGFLFSTKRR